MTAWGYLEYGFSRSQRLIQHWNYVQKSIPSLRTAYELVLQLF